MAIKRKQSVTYVTDRGLEVEVGEMETTHLVNAIAHHYRQRMTLAEVVKSYPMESTTNVHKRISSLDYTIQLLAIELETRDPDKDYDEQSGSTREFSREY